MPLSIRNGLFRPAPDTQALATSAEERLRITPSGEIGIGTLSPAEQLEVNGGVKVGFSTNNNAGTIRWNGTQMEYNDGTNWLPFGGGGSSLWSQNGSEIYYDSGNVGVGLNDPRNTFHVGGDTRIGVVAPLGGSGAASEGSRLYFSGGNSNNSWDSENSDPLWIARYNAAADTTRLRVNIGDNPDADDGMEIGFLNSGTGPWVTNFFFGSDGNFGIRTTTPSERLDVNGQARVRTLPPTTSLNNVVVADSTGVLHVRDASTIGGGGSIWDREPGTDNIFYDAGNVGIGTGSPSAKLHIEGGNIIFTGTGNMGIGIATPNTNFKLDIAGNTFQRGIHTYGRNQSPIQLTDRGTTPNTKIAQTDMKTTYVYAQVDVGNGEITIDPGLYDGQILILVCSPNTGSYTVPLSSTNTNGVVPRIAGERDATVTWMIWCAPESVWCIQR